MTKPLVVADNATPADLEPEPKGFWDSVHSQVDAWVIEFTDEGSDDDIIE